MQKQDFPDLPVWAELREMGIAVRVKAVPGASATGIAGVLGDRLKTRVTAPAESGRANRALLEVLEHALELKNGRLVMGSASPYKEFVFDERPAQWPVW